MAKGDIRLSEKHGVNPGLGICFWCGEASEVILFGKMQGDAQAPQETCLGYEPCSKCQEQFAKGIVVIEVSEDETERATVPLIENAEEALYLYPTGSHVVITREAAQRLFQPEEMVESILEHGRAVMDSEAFQGLFGEHLS